MEVDNLTTKKKQRKTQAHDKGPMPFGPQQNLTLKMQSRFFVAHLHPCERSKNLMVPKEKEEEKEMGSLCLS